MLSKAILQQIWLIIDRTSHKQFNNLSDRQLVEDIYQQLVKKVSLSDREAAESQDYIQSRIFFIRDLLEIGALMHNK